MDLNINVTDLLKPSTEKKEVTRLHLFLILWSIFLCIVDVVLDIKLTISHYNDGNIWFLVQTICSILIPAMILTGFNVWWYSSDSDIDISKVTVERRIMRILFNILLMAPLLRNFEALHDACKGRKATDERVKVVYFDRMNVFISDAAILSVFKAFMKNGPQVVLQTCIFAELQAERPNVFTSTEMWQIITICTGCGSMSFAYTTFQRDLRISLEKGLVDIPRRMSMCLWRFFDVLSRVIALGLFASVFPYYLIGVVFIRFLTMFVWIRSLKTNLFDNEYFKELIYNAVLAEMNVFIYFNPKRKRTGLRYTMYYSLICLENTALICVWYYYYPHEVRFRFPALILQFTSFVFAVVLMVIYYYYMHPTKGYFRRKSEYLEKPSESEMKNLEEKASENQEKSEYLEMLSESQMKTDEEKATENPVKPSESEMKNLEEKVTENQDS